VRRWILGIGAALLLALPPSSARAADGQALYEANCAKCHGKTGMADTTTGKAAKAKQFKGDEHILGAADVVDFVKKSIHDPEKKKHKEVAKKVTDDDLAAIAVYVKALAAP